MKRHQLAPWPISGALLIVGAMSLSGCSPEGAGSAPKLKGSKDEIQKATQSGIPGKGAPVGQAAPGRPGRRVD